MAAKRLKKLLTLTVAMVTAAPLVLQAAGCQFSLTEAAVAPMAPRARLRVATTTSLYDTGLWGYLEPMFEDEYGVELDVIYAGTGRAFECGRRGDVDVITVHSRARELQFVNDGYGIERVPFACNYFLIVGPESDPAGVKGVSPEEAFRRMADAEATFISRGDDSGTHSKEKSIWAAAGFDYQQIRGAGSWYVEVGSGMGPTLMMASEKESYTLTDMGTYLAYKGKLELVPVMEAGEILLNVYLAIVVNPDNANVKNADMAANLVSFLTSTKIQKLIGEYGVAEHEIALFNSCADADPAE